MQETIMSIKDKLTAIDQVVVELNNASDALASVVAEMEASFTKLGIAHWLDGLGYIVAEQYQLGVQRVGGAMRVVVREVEVDTVMMRIRPRGEPPVPLASAPRHVRAEAATQLEALLDDVLERAQRYVRNVQDAKRVAQGEAPSQLVAEYLRKNRLESAAEVTIFRQIATGATPEEAAGISREPWTARYRKVTEKISRALFEALEAAGAQVGPPAVK